MAPRLCPGCAGILATDGPYCEHCGRPVDGVTTTQAQSPAASPEAPSALSPSRAERTRSRRRTYDLVAVLVVIVVVLGIVIAVVFGDGSHKKKLAASATTLTSVATPTTRLNPIVVEAETLRAAVAIKLTTIQTGSPIDSGNLGTMYVGFRVRNTSSKPITNFQFLADISVTDQLGRRYAITTPIDCYALGVNQSASSTPKANPSPLDANQVTEFFTDTPDYPCADDWLQVEPYDTQTDGVWNAIGSPKMVIVGIPTRVEFSDGTSIGTAVSG